MPSGDLLLSSPIASAVARCDRKRLQSRGWKTKFSREDRAELEELYQASNFSLHRVRKVIKTVKQLLQKSNIAAPSHLPISAAGSQDLMGEPYSAYGFNLETSEPSTSFSLLQTSAIAVR